jgi:hypothetical protein
LQSSNRGLEGDASRGETRTLIAASKVKGTVVYNRQGEALGSVYDVMIDKRSGDVAYAGDVVRRVPGHWQELPSGSLEHA